MSDVERRAAPGWLLVLGVTGLALGLVAAFGGFAPSPGRIGPELPAGRTISLANWDIIVHRAEVGERTPGLPSDKDVLRIQLTITRTAKDSQFVPIRLLTIRTGTDVPVDPDGYVSAPDRRATDFDPDIPREVDLVFWYPAYEASYPGEPPKPDQVVVLVRDERPGTGFLDGDSFEVGDLVGHVRLDCPDRRVRR